VSVIVNLEPFAPIARLEARVEELEALNAAYLADQTALCELVADKDGKIARLEQQVAALNKRLRTGEYRFTSATTEGSGRFRIQEVRR